MEIRKKDYDAAFYLVSGVAVLCFAVMIHAILSHGFGGLVDVLYEKKGIMGFFVMYFVIIVPFYFAKIREKNKP